MEIKTINLDAADASTQLSEIQTGQLFKCEKLLGGKVKWFTGYFAESGVFWMAGQSFDGYNLSPIDARELVEYAIDGHEESEPEQEDDSVHFSHPDYLNNYKMPRERTAWRKMQ